VILLCDCGYHFPTGKRQARDDDEAAPSSALPMPAASRFAADVSGRRYAWLRFVAIVYRVSAVVVVLFGLVRITSTLNTTGCTSNPEGASTSSSSEPPSKLLEIVAWAVGTFLSFASLMAAAESIHVLLSIDARTRALEASRDA
jgi:hypothetical protein